jgi:hypothetical protein
LPQAGGRMAGDGGGELADGLRAENAHHGAEGEVVLGRHDAGEGAEEPVIGAVTYTMVRSPFVGKAATARPGRW